MKKCIKALTFIIAICILLCAFSACSILNMFDKNPNDGKTDNSGNDNGNETVNGLPKITLTEGMTVEEIKATLADVKNYTLRVNTTSDENETLQQISRYCENGFIYSYTENGKCTGKLAEFITEKYFYEFVHHTDSENNTDEYKYSVKLLDDVDAKDFLKYYEPKVALNGMFEDSNSYSIVNGQLIFEEANSDESVSYIFYNFNNTVLNIEEYFPDYKSLEVGEYTNMEENQ